MMQKVLASSRQPTAIFAANNFIAMGALRAMRDAGLRVPDDIALVTFDDIPSALMVDPFLTVAAQPGYEMGRQATELLLARLSGPATLAFQEVILPTEIIIRHSSGLPRNGRHLP
jgi:LacI family transcriptional regulator